jgi:Flp pilus assembly protein TadG
MPCGQTCRQTCIGRLGLAARGAWRERQGAQAIEFALVAPTLLLLILGGMEFGHLLWTLAALHMSVEQAARCGAVGICTSSTAAAYATTVAPQLNFSSSVFSVNATATCGFQVTANFTYQFIATGLFPYQPNLTAMACFP